MKVFWGTREEIDRYIAEERRSRERDEWVQQFDDLVGTAEVVSAVVSALQSPRVVARQLLMTFTNTYVKRGIR